MHRGESQLDPTIARKVMDAFRNTMALQKVKPPSDDEPPIEPLTKREIEILELIAQGLSNKDIAVRLNLTEGTVRNYSSNILSKLHAFDRTQAVIKAARHGIVKL